MLYIYCIQILPLYWLPLKDLIEETHVSKPRWLHLLQQIRRAILTITTNNPPKCLFLKECSADRWQTNESLKKVNMTYVCVCVCALSRECKKGTWVTRQTLNNISISPGPEHQTVEFWWACWDDNRTACEAMRLPEQQCLCVWGDMGLKVLELKKGAAADLPFLWVCLTVLKHASAAARSKYSLHGFGNKKCILKNKNKHFLSKKTKLGGFPYFRGIQRMYSLQQCSSFRIQNGYCVSERFNQVLYVKHDLSI